MFTGVITALVTPFRGGALDEEALRRLVSEQIAAGIDGLVPVGTTGESPTVTVEEHVRIIKVVVEEAKKRVPVIAGTGGNSTKEAIELSRARQGGGADGMLQVTPYYNKPTQDGLYRHFKAIIDEVPLPTVVYNVPGRTGCDLLPETAARLCDIPPGGGHQGGDRLGPARGADPLPLRGSPGGAVGRRRHRLPALRAGRQGLHLGHLQRRPRDMARDVGRRRGRRLGQGARAALQAVRHQRGPVHRGQPHPGEGRLAMLGKIADEIRPPLYPMTGANRDKVQEVLVDLKLL
jgi:4-hydroxy-tetrahydrodipicolinate synthase